MTSMSTNSSYEADPRLERVFVEREQNRLAGRALLVLVILNVENGWRHHGASRLSARACRSNHSAPIGPSGWLAWRRT